MEATQQAEPQPQEPAKPLTLEERQLALEEEMQDLGIERYYAEIERAKERRAESETKYGQMFLAEIMEKVVPAIKAWFKEEKGVGRPHVALKYLKVLKPETSAFIATRTILDSLSLQLPLTGTAIRLANCIEDEVRFRSYNKLEDKQKRNYYRKVKRNLAKETRNSLHQRRVIKGTMRKIGAPDWDNWSSSDKVQLGVKLIELVVQSIGIIQVINRPTGKNRSLYCIEPTEKGRSWISGFNSTNALLTPQFLPMLVPPRDWTNPYDGGYLSEFLRRRIHLVKTPYRDYLEELSNKDLSVVYGGVNAMQQTGFKIDKRVYLVLRKMWNSGSQVGKLPPREDEPKPTRPADIETNRDARREWRRAAHEVEKRNVKLASKRLQVSRTIMVAKRFTNEEAIYFPYQLDFRGRAYAVPMFLHPQGPDYAKALLTFSKGKAITDKIAANWLAIHGANLYGYDKVSFADRVAWVQQNKIAILESATKPMDCDWWTKADKPWQFLAFCFEWADFLRTGYGFVSCLPVALDGSCNGLQHFSALLKDEVGGAAVNLLPSPKPQDIYQVVADKLVAKLRIKAASDHQARAWLALGITRKSTKRCVMVLPYGGTLYAFRKYLQEHIRERIAEGAKNPFGTEKFYIPAAYLATLLQEAIGETVKAAVQAMGWLQTVAELIAEQGLPINWTAPSGFPVLQAYRDTPEERVKTQIFGETIKLHIRPTDTAVNIDKRRQANGIAPNFVHSLDAAAMMHCLVDSVALGIDSFAMIHDSYATVAADTEQLTVALRYAFVHQVYNTDLMAKFAEEVSALLNDNQKLPDLPASGSLDIAQVEQSPFFFA
jgi:DNA-directed RNA polymerase, mitochondrial